MKKIIIALSVVFAVILGISTYADKMQNKVSDNVLRLHILANSDNPNDQALKLAVRDSLLEESRDLFSGCSSSEESKEIFMQEKDHLTSVAEKTIQSYGYAYPVTLSLEETYFPTRYYDNIALPAGNYDAVKVNIGNAAGKNWWCVMFPPLCFVDESVSMHSNMQLVESVGNDAPILTPSSPSDVKIKFKVVDIFQSAKHVIKNSFRRT